MTTATTTTNPPPYMAEPWFALLRQACDGRKRVEVAALLGLSPAAVSQVLNGSGKYGAGKARTDRIALRVLHILNPQGELA